MKIKNILLLAAMLSAMVCTGCVALVAGGAAAAGAGAVAYVNGELKTTESTSLEHARNATMIAIKEMQFGIVGDETDGLTQHISVRTSTDKKVTITLVKESDTVTAIGVRVGVFGDEVLSMQVLNKIKSHL